MNRIDIIYEYIGASPYKIINIPPHTAPRMSSSDKWKKRKCVTDYWTWKDAFNCIRNIQKINLPDVLNVLFIIPMPTSWSHKKQEQFCGQPHMQRPDRDNLLKAVQDAFNIDDGYVWDGRTTKVWGYQEDSCIIFYENVD